MTERTGNMEGTLEFRRKGPGEILKQRIVCGREGDRLPLLYFPLLEETGLVEHCFTTRAGGVSRGDCESLNLSFTRGDDPGAVKENFSRVARAFGTAPERFVLSDQTHTTCVRRVTEKDGGHGLTRKKEFFDVDGLITDVPGLVLSTFYADCVPLYFVDPVKRAIGLSHSGWRGTVGRMGRVTVEAMGREFGTRPEDLFCAVGPSICRDCYEVGQDVAEEFAAEFSGQKEKLLVEKGNGKYLLNLWRANEILLQEAGVPKEQIAVTDICTCCNPKLLFSHRASGGKRGNLGAFLMIKEK